MEQAEIIGKIRPFILETFYVPDDSVADDGALFTSGLLDSADLVTLLMFVEERFGISIPDQDITIDRFDTLLQMSAYLQGQLDS